jgi:predicted phosphoadenosine phosphosulfate sulfurtransferase
LDSFPPKTKEHYLNKIATYLNFYKKKNIPVIDYSKPKSNEDVPSWFLICRALLRNDYWCTSLGFKITKSAHYEKYLDLMKKRREHWKII